MPPYVVLAAARRAARRAPPLDLARVRGETEQHAPMPGGPGPPSHAPDCLARREGPSVSPGARRCLTIVHPLRVDACQASAQGQGKCLPPPRALGWPHGLPPTPETPNSTWTNQPYPAHQPRWRGKWSKPSRPPHRRLRRRLLDARLGATRISPMRCTLRPLRCVQGRGHPAHIARARRQRRPRHPRRARRAGQE